MLDAKLVMVGSDSQIKELKLTLPTIVGRGREANISIWNNLLSHRHCEIYEENSVLRVRDLKSLNGTYVGSTRIRDAALPPGELLTVGPVTFRAVYKADPEAVVAAHAADEEELVDDTVGSPPAQRPAAEGGANHDTVNVNTAFLEETDDFVKPAGDSSPHSTHNPRTTTNRP